MVRQHTNKSAPKQKPPAKRNSKRLTKADEIDPNQSTIPLSTPSNDVVSPNPFAILTSSESSSLRASNESSSYHPSSSSTASASQQPSSSHPSTNHLEKSTKPLTFKDVLVAKNMTTKNNNEQPDPVFSPSSEPVPSSGILEAVNQTEQVYTQNQLVNTHDDIDKDTTAHDPNSKMSAIMNLVLLKLDHLEVKMNDMENVRSVRSGSRSRSQVSRPTTVPVNVQTHSTTSQQSNDIDSTTSIVHEADDRLPPPVVHDPVEPQNATTAIHASNSYHRSTNVNNPTSYHQNHESHYRTASITSESQRNHNCNNYQQNQFNQNSFSLLVSGAPKLKFSSMQTYLKDKALANETAQAFEELYTHINMGVSFIFDNSVNVLPPFQQLDKDINFSQILLHNLCSNTYEKCLAVFQKIGSLLKLYILSSTFLLPSTAPNVETIRKANISQDGWTILEAILKDNLVACGARIKFDLDKTRILLFFNDNESYTDFYVKTQNVLNEYKLNYRDEAYVPRIKLTDTFVTQLS